MLARDILEAVKAGTLSVEAAHESLATLPFREIDGATVDAHRALRQGLPEVIFGQRKTPDQVVRIAKTLFEASQNVLVTRLDPDAADEVCAALPGAVHSPVARTLRLEVRPVPARVPPGPVVVITAGTSDLPVAEEACETLLSVGITPTRAYDLGVAGLHRMLSRIELLREASAVIAIAGMEGALPSVLGGLVTAPVVAVPTSVGYGAALSGLTPLMAMLTSCASGITVVNIDNGFGAALAVHRIVSILERSTRGSSDAPEKA